jgi:hypothetical protein
MNVLKAQRSLNLFAEMVAFVLFISIILQMMLAIFAAS